MASAANLVFYRCTAVDLTDKIPERHPLPAKPLIEAMLELRWDLAEGAQQGLTVDPGFRFFMGRYYDRVRAQYPHVQDLPVSEVPENFTGHVVRHQFWTRKKEWPVTQIGPGILTVNETDGYLWDTFRPRLIASFKALFDSYPTEITPLRLNQITLRYIDAVAFDPENSDVPILNFLRESLHTTVAVDPQLFSDPKEAESPLGLNVSLTYRTKKPSGVVVLSLGNGVKADVPSIIWETKVVSSGENVPIDLQGFEAWLDDAHTVSDKWFFTLIRGRLLESFEENPDAKQDANSDFQSRT
jgi:uncharacterized protein (TIGR04255 family)